MVEKKQSEIQELVDELDIIFSVKDNISQDEIYNLENKFTALSEYDIRSKIAEITGDNSYVEKFSAVESNSLLKIEDKLQNDNEKKSNLEHNAEMNSSNYEKNFIEKADKLEKIKNKEYDLGIDDNIQLHSSSSAPNTDKQLEPQHEEKVVFDEANIPSVSFVKAEIKYGQLSLEWGWPQDINRVLLCYRMDRFPAGPRDSSASHLIIEREGDFETGDYTINKVEEGNYYFCIYTLVEIKGEALYSEGQKRLVVNKVPEEIFYEIKIKRSFLGKLKSVELILSTTSREINSPELVLISRVGNMPIQKSDGEALFNIDYQTLKGDETIGFELPVENIRKNMYVKLFFVDDSNSKIYRIISPAKEKLHFK